MSQFSAQLSALVRSSFLCRKLTQHRIERDNRRRWSRHCPASLKDRSAQQWTFLLPSRHTPKGSILKLQQNQQKSQNQTKIKQQSKTNQKTNKKKKMQLAPFWSHVPLECGRSIPCHRVGGAEIVRRWKVNMVSRRFSVLVYVSDCRPTAVTSIPQ